MAEEEQPGRSSQERLRNRGRLASTSDESQRVIHQSRDG